MSTQTETPTLNGLQVKALLLDTITHYKHGQHLAPNYMSFKRVFLKSMGLKANANDLTVLTAIGNLYNDNGLRSEFTATMAKFNWTSLLHSPLRGRRTKP